MKLTKFLIPAALIALSGCEKELIVDAAPDFDVAVASGSFKAGEPVNFSITGFADIISFYSGEPRKEYDFKDGRIVELGYKGATLSFNTGITGTGTQINDLSVLVSGDFNGDYSNLASIKAASWTDITDSLKLAASATFTSAGSVDISRFTETGGPVYVAFRYITKPQLENGAAKTWMVEAFNVSSIETYNNAVLPFMNQTFAAFTIIDEDPENTPSRSTVTTTRLSLLGNTYEDPESDKYDPENPIYDPENPIYDPQSHLYDPLAVRPEYVPYDPNNPYNDPLRETWAISAPIRTDKVDLGPDRPVGIRGIRNPRLTEYAYTFANPGTYQVTFVGTNATKDDQKTVVRKLTVTVAP
ncbi:MAG: hypothetical protein ABS46_20750 [Cytophagaceae bacterium SCN 52-12]|nr:MAG: hypothetical protein ABS46_20750 [Cytophagaceae bacterium SCN 52-12]